MASIDKEQYKTALCATVRSAGALGFAVNYNPFSVTPWPTVKAEKPTPLKQWLLGDDELVTSVVREYNDLGRGVVKQIMSGTSSGKTTKVPVAIAFEHKQVVAVLFPNPRQARWVEAYFRKIVKEQYGVTNAVSVLDPDNARRTVKAPHIFLSSAGDFLALMCSNPKMLTRLPIHCIVLDESHECSPPYVVVPILIQIGKFASTRILYASATAAGDIGMESSSRREVRSVSPSVLVRTPDGSTPASPAHESRISQPTLLFAADDAEARLWERYYTDHDVPTAAFGYSSGMDDLKALEGFLAKGGPRVVVTTSVAQTSYTLPVETVIDLGYTTRMKSDFARAAVELTVVPETLSERTQRAGRVGRLGKRGMAYYADVRCSNPVGPDDPDIQAYVYLWMKMFGVEVKNPQIAAFEQVFGGLSREVVATLLVLPLPPVVTLPYFGDGGFLVGFARGFRQISPCRQLVGEEIDAVMPKLEEWEDRVVPELLYDDMEMVYKARNDHPGEWALLLYHVWHTFDRPARWDTVSEAGFSVYHRSMSNNRDHRRSGSFGNGKNRRTYVPADPRASIEAVGPDFTLPPYSRPNPVSPVAEEDSPVEELPVRAKLPSYSAPVTPPRQIKSRDGTRERQRQSVLAENDELERVETWRRSAAVASPGSKSSSDPDTPSLKRVNPSTYWRWQLMPADQTLYGVWKTEPVARELDFARVRRCLRGQVSFASLDANSPEILRERQSDYFLSFLRAHNNAVIGMLQAKASVGYRTKKLLWFETKDAAAEDYDKCVEKAKSTAGLLSLAESVGFLCAIDRRAQHGRGSVSSHDTTLQAKREMEAQFALGAGPAALYEVVDLCDSLAKPLVRQGYRGRVVANGWVFCNRMWTASHAYHDLSESQKSAWLMDAEGPVSLVQDVLSAPCAMEMSRDLLVRDPVEGECVYIAALTDKSGRVSFMGFHQLFSVDGEWAFQGTYWPGVSGALVIAAEDGAVVGMYVGAYVYDDAEPFSRVCLIRY